MGNEYPKLVRDNIPAIIEEKEGFRPTHRILENDAEFLAALFKKVTEEATELGRSVENENTEEELADLLELIETIVASLGKTVEDIKNIQKEKREKRGGFEKRILMDEPRRPRS